MTGSWRASRALAVSATILALSLGSWSIAVAPASAHQGDPNYLSEITSISPDTPGLSAEIVNYDSDIVLENDSDSLVEFEGYEGEPYLRFRPDGIVEANTRSPAYYLNNDRYGTSEVPASADPEAKPQWEEVSDDGRYSWHDHRSHYMSRSLPPQVSDESVRTKVFDYSLPIEIDGEPGSIDGTLFWVGEPTPSKLPFILIAVALVLLVPATIVIRRRRGDGARPAAGGRKGGDGADPGDGAAASSGKDRGEAW